MGRSASKVLAVIAFAGAAALGAKGVGEATRDFDDAAWGRALEGRLRETTAALRARIATLAELPIVAAAVSTDAHTVRDLTQDELAFRPRRGETIAIGQVAKAGPEVGRPVVLLALPDLAHAPALHPPAPQIRIDAGHLVVSEAIKVAPRERADEIDGVVAASLSVDVDDFSKRLRLAGIAARITVGGLGLDVGQPHRAGGARRFDVAVKGPAGVPLQLALDAPPSESGMRFLGGAAAFALVGLLFVLRLRRSAGVPLVVPGPLPAIWTPPAPVHPVSPPSSPAATTVVIGEVDRKIGRYEIVQQIGSGGMADVYLAHSTGEAGFTKKIALKALSPDYAAQPALVEQFLDEARLAALLDHPNIVQIIDLGQADGAYFIAMEYVDGADLRYLIDASHRQGRPIAPAVAVAILRKICDGLHAAHTTRAPDGAPLGLVHRDVKSSNVFVARNGAVKIGDFGIAKADHASRMTRTEHGLVKGTPGYMSPEQRMGQPIDGRADMYGVGAIAYEMLSGVSVNLDFMLVSKKGKAGWPHLGPLAQFRDDVPPELEAAIFRTLAYEAEDRFADCAALELALEEIAKKYPPIAGDKTIARWIEATLVEGRVMGM